MWQSFSTIHNVKWDHDCSSIPSLANPLSASWQFQVSLLSSLSWPASPLSSNFPLLLSQGPHWEYYSDPGLWAPKPALILCIDRPEKFLPSAAGSSALTLCGPEQPALLSQRDGKDGVRHFTLLPNRWVLLMLCVILDAYSRWHVARESATVVASPNSVRLWLALGSSCIKNVQYTEPRSAVREGVLLHLPRVLGKVVTQLIVVKHFWGCEV